MSANTVHYHLPEDEQFSLDFASPDREVVDERLAATDPETETRVRVYDLAEPVYVVYEKSHPVERVDDLEFDFLDAFAAMTPSTRVIVRELLEIFRTIQRGRRREGDVSLDAYKEIEIERIPDALEQVAWGRSVEETGGQLLANLILTHALPNANHRTSFGFLGEYLNAIDPTFGLPRLVTENHDWQSWVEPYVFDSKRLLTVRRNVGPFRYLSRFGCETVRRKGGIEIHLAEYDLDMTGSDALSRYARRHEERTVEFVETLLRRVDRTDLLGRPGLDKESFATYIRELD